MAIYGVGIDLIRVDRLQKVLDRWGDHFIARVFTPAEAAACSERKALASCLSMRFAAKEAFSKALGRGLRDPILWRDIEVVSDSLGKPEIVLSERASEFCKSLGVSSWHLSLTDDGDYGAAVVLVEKQ